MSLSTALCSYFTTIQLNFPPFFDTLTKIIVGQIALKYPCVMYPVSNQQCCLCSTCVYVLGVISRTRQGSDVLKALGWDSVRHSRRQQWPVVPDEVDAPLPSELSSVPSTLSLNSESTSSRHNSESESQPSESMHVLNVATWTYLFIFFSPCLQVKYLNWTR